MYGIMRRHWLFGMTVRRELVATIAVVLLAMVDLNAQDVPDGLLLTVEAGQSRTLRLDRPSAVVSVSDPAIADVQVVSTDLILVYGKAGGRTSLVAFGSDGGLIGRWRVTVTVGLAGVRSALSEDPELRDVVVRPRRDGVELSGVVASAAVVERVLQLTRASLPENSLVVNRLSIASPQQVELGVRSALSEDPELRDVVVRPLRDGVELSGVVASAAVVERALQLARASLPENSLVVNRLSIASPQQVNLEVQIAEVQRSVSESLGINWQAMGTRGDGVFGMRVGHLLPVSPGELVNNFPGASLQGGQASSLFGSYTSPTGSASVRSLIDALATAGLATVLARPNVTAVSGQTASFFSGGEYPLPSGFEAGQLSFEYKKYGVLLDFVPTVIDSDRISLTVRPEVSQRVGTDALKIFDTEIPVIDVRRAETTIEVGDGESIVIAGLYRNQSDTTEAGLPGLKDVPALGLLFGNRTVRSNSTELIVVVTAHLISPADRNVRGAAQRVLSRRVQGYHY